jgi:predicted aspartyl protease
MRKFAILLIFTLLCSWSLLSEKEPTDALVKSKKIKLSEFSDPVPVWTNDRIRLPFRFAGNLILVQVKADSVVGDFILDTGAPHLVLNKTYFRNYPMYGEVMAAGITGSAGTGSQTRVGKLDFGGLHFDNVDADVVSLGHLESQRGTKILGLIGLNLLKKLELTIDFNEGTLEFVRINRQGEPIDRPMALADSSAMELRMTGNFRLIYLNGSIGGKMLRFCLDTGAEANVLHSELNNKVMQQVKLLRAASVSGSGAKKSEALIGRLNLLTMSCGDYPALTTSVMNISALREIYEESIDGILGMDFLYRHGKMQINMNKGKVFLWKRVE